MKIALIGPESTGKTTLAKALSEKFGFNYIEEYARHYLSNKGLDYDYQDLINIANKQHELILQTNEETINIIDTELITIKIWSKYRFHKYPEIFDSWIKNETIDFYLLNYPDLPWEPDPLRENKNDLLHLFSLYEHELNKINAEYWLVSGLNEQRLRNVSNLLKYKKVLS